MGDVDQKPSPLQGRGLGEGAVRSDDPLKADIRLSSALSPDGERGYLRLRDDAPHDEPAVTLDAFLGQSNATAVRIEAGDDARALLPHLGRIALVEVSFPTFRDGRGYSAGRILREGGYTGELRAAGDVLVDQIAFLRRCGFDSFAPDAELNAADVAAALTRYAHVYQAAADGAVPVWKLRHG